MEGMDTLWALIVSILVPLVTGLLVRKSYAKWIKALVAFVLSAIVGVVSVYIAGQWTGDVAVIILACYGTAQTTFWIVVDRVPGLKDWLLSQFNRDPA